MTRDEIKDIIYSVVCEKMDINKSEVNENTNFTKDLRMDSIEKAEMMMSLEEKFDLGSSDEELEGIATFADAIDFVEKCLKDTE